MLRVRSRLSVKHLDNDTISIVTSAQRRITFALISALLMVSFIVGTDWARDFTQEMLAGSLFYIGLTVFCMAVAAYSSGLVVDRRLMRLEFVSRIAGIALRRRTVKIGNGPTVVLQSIALLKDAERPRESSLQGSRFGQIVSRRNGFYKLYLEFEQTREFIEDSTDREELQTIGDTLAKFLNISFRHEDG